MWRHRLHMRMQSFKSEHACMNSINFVPQLAGRGFPGFAKADHHKFPYRPVPAHISFDLR
jgi:hypothetical protein